METLNIEEALGTLKMLLGIKDNERDGLLSFLLEDTVNMILGYCRITELPEKLYTAVPAIAADMFRRKGYGRETAPKVVKSVSQGKRSMSVECAAFDTDGFIKEYNSRLEPFISRRGRVPSDVG